MTFDPETAAVLEMRYWDDHRRLVGADDKREFLETLAALHAELFGISREQAMESAEWRLKAADTVDLITGKHSVDVAGDWARILQYLRQCYRSIQRALDSQDAAEPPPVRRTE